MKKKKVKCQKSLTKIIGYHLSAFIDFNELNIKVM